MIRVKRFIGNPILSPNPQNAWEGKAAFNPCPVEYLDKTYLLYRAESSDQKIGGKNFPLSTIGICESSDRVSFENRRQFIKNEFSWEKYGCEDPRVTKIDDKFYIFYTALSKYPPDKESIRIGLAISKDLKKIEEKHLVTPFNAKAMNIFPKKINGNFVGILTADTDVLPSKIGIAYFKSEDQIWDERYWQNWYRKIDHYVLPLLRSTDDQVEVGAVPIETEKGWLLIFSYIKNYLSSEKIFGIEIVLLDLDNPLKIIGKIEEAFMVPEKDYELKGNVPNIIFPSGAIINNNEVGIYYGACDTSCCLATFSLKEVLSSLQNTEYPEISPGSHSAVFKRAVTNPIISPVPERIWESKFTLNPAAIMENGKIFVVYRAMGNDNTSVLGLAVSEDGTHVNERLPDPIYVPREPFEAGLKNRFSGCEDPRIVKIDNKFYITYTAYDGKNPARVALSSIEVSDFLNRIWNWKKPVLLSPPGKDDKNACIVPERINGKYPVLHRFSPSIWIDFADDLEKLGEKWLEGEILMTPRINMWDSEKLGIGPPPIKTDEGWILIYHGISRFDKKYRLGAALLDFTREKKVISRLPYPILEPYAEYEYEGFRPGTVFACGAVEKDGKIYVYYGGADEFVCVATISFSKLLDDLKNYMV